MLVIRARFGLITKLLIVHLLYQITFVKATRPRHMRTRPMLHEAEAEAEAQAQAKTYEAEARKFGPESRT